MSWEFIRGAIREQEGGWADRRTGGPADSISRKQCLTLRPIGVDHLVLRCQIIACNRTSVSWPGGLVTL
jgi:hypothetical protein